MIALALTGQGVPVWIVASSSERLVSMSPGSRSRVLMSLLFTAMMQLLGVDHAAELGLVDDLHERREPVTERELDQVLERLGGQDLAR